MKMQQLVDDLNYYTKCYDEGSPVITDKQWDDMYFTLLAMERDTGIILPDSPTQSIRFNVVSKLKKVTHSHPMLSLDKTKSIDELNSFIGDKEYIIMGKMDGLTCSLRYEHGILVGAETRGDGAIGENIFHNACKTKSIPLNLNEDITLVVDGEIICTYQDFKQFENEYANPRNFASGSIRLLDARESAKRSLTFVAWDIISDNFRTLEEKLLLLHELDFITVPYGLPNSKVTEDLINKYKKECVDLDYPIDGLVIKYNICTEYEAAGRTENYFKGGIAFKFYDEEYETKLKDIEWTMGRSGQLTPIAIFEPVDTGDSIIERASLHNVSIMKQTLHGTGYIGQKIKVAKMNDIIPQVVWAEGE